MSWEQYNEAARAAFQNDEFSEAERLWLAARDAAGKFGPKDPRLAATLTNLAVLYRTEGRHGEAERINRQALDIWEGALEHREDKDVVTALDNLAEIYHAEQRYSEAEPLHKRALAIREKVLGSEHPDVASSLEHYGSLLHEMERHEEASNIEERAKTIRAHQAPGSSPK
ncbi:MAG: tetratricopeptide repeat protein [Acidobacteria bacterium]|nr:tetratricopeptide repeat protein [Acidobacteriota bacterium]